VRPRRPASQLAVRGLVRRRDTPAQARLDASAQADEPGRGVRRPERPIAQAIVALVDDVLTTGATADACARALRAPGAERVVVLTVGRTP
jgi:predicted amidophosphoribosyltransferase